MISDVHDRRGVVSADPLDPNVTWDQARVRRLTWQQLSNRWSALNQQMANLERLLGTQESELVRFMDLRNSYLSMRGLTGRWLGLRDGQVLRLSALIGDLEARIRVSRSETAQYHSMLELLAGLVTEAGEATS